MAIRQISSPVPSDRWVSAEPIRHFCAVGALTDVRFTQALSENFVLYAGKINTIDNVQQPFMPGRGLDAGFMNASLVWNVILARTLNYATLGAGAAVLQHGVPGFQL